MPRGERVNAKSEDLPGFAMRLSLGAGFGMLATKLAAYRITGSTAILADAAESVVHVVAVSFAAYSLWLSRKPPDASHSYGHDKITFFSAGFEGAMIILASGYILYTSILRWMHGLKLEHLGAGTLLELAAGLINGGLGAYLVHVGRRYRSLILVADGKHVLVDCWTSLGVIVGLSLVLVTGWLPLDPLCAIVVAMNILWTGGKLVRQSVSGLMDAGDPATGERVRHVLEEMTRRAGIRYHGLRYRNAGNTIWVEFHLLFPTGTLLETAHEIATRIEDRIRHELDIHAEVITHLEPLESHSQVHPREH